MFRQARFEFCKTTPTTLITLNVNIHLLQNTKFRGLINELHKMGGVEVLSLEEAQSERKEDTSCWLCNNPLEITRNEFGIYDLACCE